MFLGLMFGITIYMLTLSRIIIKIFVLIIKYIKNIIKISIKIIIIPIKFIYNLIDKVIIRPIYLISIKLHLNFKKKIKNISNNIKKTNKIEKNVKNS